MSDDSKPKRPVSLRPVLSLDLRRVSGEAKPVAVRSLSLGDQIKPVETREPPPLFETVRVIDLARLRSGLIRSLLRKTDDGIVPQQQQKQDFLKLLDKLRDLSTDGMPHVAVVRRSHASGLATNYSIVGNLIFLGAHLSKSWVAGKEDAAYQDTLKDAISTYVKRLESHSGTRTLSRLFYH